MTAAQAARILRPRRIDGNIRRISAARGADSAIHKFPKITRCRHCKDAMVFNL
jgi:hypothetical protein